MQIDHALILSAGLGTRMGAIGKKLPKALWPVFYKSLLELQVDYCHDLGIDSIFINTHFLSEEIENYLKTDPKFSKVIALHEDPLLDSGGAIHNMASRGDVHYSGNLLLLNADQFLFFDIKYFAEAISGLENSRASLFGITVDKSEKYNKTILVDDRLTNIIKNDNTENYVTYSGLGILKLDGLEPVAGITKFWDTVANFNKERIQFVVPNKFEYWDFGTAEIYFESIKQIYENKKNSNSGMLMNFLNKHNVFRGDESNFFSQELNSISLEGTNAFEENSIVGKGIIQPLLV